MFALVMQRIAVEDLANALPLHSVNTAGVANAPRINRRRALTLLLASCGLLFTEISIGHLNDDYAIIAPATLGRRFSNPGDCDRIGLAGGTASRSEAIRLQEVHFARQSRRTAVLTNARWLAPLIRGSGLRRGARAAAMAFPLGRCKKFRQLSYRWSQAP